MDEHALRIGRLEAHAKNTTDTVRRIEAKTDAQTAKLDQLLGQRAVERGEHRARKALLVGGVAGAGWLINVVVEWLKK